MLSNRSDKSKNSVKKYSEIAIGVLLSAVFLGALVLLARPGTPASVGSNSNSSEAKTLLTAAESEFSFGTISMAKGLVAKSLAIKNSGAQPALIERIYTSCMCTAAVLKTPDGKTSGPYGMAGHGFMPRVNKTLAPGEEAKIEITFDPNAHGPAGVGRIERSVAVEGNFDPLELGFDATVTP